MQVRRVLWRMPLEAKDTEPRSDDRFDLRIIEEARVATTAFSLGPLHFQFHPHDMIVQHDGDSSVVLPAYFINCRAKA